jgi:hypothetical protein
MNGRGRSFTCHETLHGSSQMVDLLAVQLLHMGQCLGGIRMNMLLLL